MPYYIKTTIEVLNKNKANRNNFYKIAFISINDSRPRPKPPLSLNGAVHEKGVTSSYVG